MCDPTAIPYTPDDAPETDPDAHITRILAEQLRAGRAQATPDDPRPTTRTVMLDSGLGGVIRLLIMAEYPTEPILELLRSRGKPQRIGLTPAVLDALCAFRAEQRATRGPEAGNDPAA